MIKSRGLVISGRRCKTHLGIPSGRASSQKGQNSDHYEAIKLPVIMIGLIKKYKGWHTTERLKLGDQWQDTGRLFTAWNGAPMHPDVLSGWFENFIKRTDLPQKIHLHSLQHPNATLMIAGREDVLTVSRRLGHAQASTTTNIYGHAIQSANARAAEILETY